MVTWSLGFLFVSSLQFSPPSSKHNTVHQSYRFEFISADDTSNNIKGKLCSRKLEPWFNCIRHAPEECQRSEKLRWRPRMIHDLLTSQRPNSVGLCPGPSPIKYVNPIPGIHPPDFYIGQGGFLDLPRRKNQKLQGAVGFLRVWLTHALVLRKQEWVRKSRSVESLCSLVPTYIPSHCSPATYKDMLSHISFLSYPFEMSSSMKTHHLSLSDQF